MGGTPEPLSGTGDARGGGRMTAPASDHVYDVVVSDHVYDVVVVLSLIHI